jgi:HlyD family secretion protein
MKKYKWIIWALVIILAGIGIWFWKFKEEEKPVVLETEQPHYGTIATSVTATGTVQPVDTVSVGTQVSGTISKVYVDFNDRVKKGQLIAEIDKTILQAQRDQISANLRQARANLDYSKSNFNRQKQLLDVGAISRAEYETALNTFNSANDNVNGIAAQLKAAQQNLYYANIYSPIDGTVLTRNVSVGQTVAASLNTPTLFVIAKDLTKMQVQAAVDEADIGNVKNGQRVTFTVDAFPDNVFEGRVNEVRLRPSVSSNVVTY